jgi:hypothetical protein
MDDLDVGIVYNSTVGMEMAYRGIPVIVGGDSHYRDLGFTYDPDSQKEYFALLNRIGGLETKDNTEALTERYCYFFFVQKHIGVPFRTVNSGASQGPFQISYDDIRPGNANFDLLVDQILSDESVFREVA